MSLLSVSVFSQISPAASAEVSQTLETAPIEAMQGQAETSFVIPDSPIDRGTAGAQPNTIWLFVRMILVLALVVACIYGLMFLLKKGSIPRDAENPFLKKAASLTLAPGKTVQLITMPDKAWLLGVSDAGINLIGEIKDKDLVNQMILEAEKTPASKPKDFASLLSIFTDTARNAESALIKQRERLQGRKRHE